VTQSHFDESAHSADTSDNHVAERDEPAGRDVTTEPAERDEATKPAERDDASDSDEATDSGEATDADEAAAEPDEPTEPDDPATAPDADPRVRDAVRRMDDLSDLPPAEHVEVYEAVHSSLQESLASASRQADESPPDGSSPS
jgi:hypothetical protein